MRRFLFSPDPQGDGNAPQEPAQRAKGDFSMGADEFFADLEPTGTMKLADEPKETDPVPADPTPEPQKADPDPVPPPDDSQPPVFFESKVLGGKKIDVSKLDPAVLGVLEEQERLARTFQSDKDKALDALTRQRPAQQAPPPVVQPSQPKIISAKEIEEAWEAADNADDEFSRRKAMKEARELERVRNERLLEKARRQDQERLAVIQDQLANTQLEREITEDGTDLLRARGAAGDGYAVGYYYRQALAHFRQQFGGRIPPSKVSEAEHYALQAAGASIQQQPTKQPDPPAASPGATPPTAQPRATGAAPSAPAGPRGSVTPKRNANEPQNANLGTSEGAFDFVLNQWQQRMASR